MESFKTNLTIKIFNKTPWELPKYATEEASGFDLRAFLPSPLTIFPGQRFLIPTGIYLQLPRFYECQVRPRSGLANKSGISIVNTPGTVDSDYRGEIHVNLINLGHDAVTINPGDRIAQGVIVPVCHASWEPVNSLEDLSLTDRGGNGHGSTGV